MLSARKEGGFDIEVEKGHMLVLKVRVSAVQMISQRMQGRLRGSTFTELGKQTTPLVYVSMLHREMDKLIAECNGLLNSELVGEDVVVDQAFQDTWSDFGLGNKYSRDLLKGMVDHAKKCQKSIGEVLACRDLTVDDLPAKLANADLKPEETNSEKVEKRVRGGLFNG